MSNDHDGVSILRLYLLRAMYLLLGLGLAVMIWPGIVRPPADLPHLNTAVRSLLGALALLAFLGIRYPLKMLPLLLFELAWKSIWLIAFALPRWSAGTLDSAMRQELGSFIATVVVVAIVLPWGHVLREYARVPGSPWRRTAPVHARGLSG